jgi:PKD repeat protein
VSLYWADVPDGETPNLSHVIGGPVYSLSTETAVGPHGPINVPASVLGNPPAGATHLLVVADPVDDAQLLGAIAETDETNNVAALALRTVTPPVADAGGPYTVVIGLSVQLSGSATDNNPATLSYAWDLDNDGQYDDATGATPTFSAAGLSAGTYTVGLRVTDDEGLSATATATIHVITVLEFTNNTITTASQQITDLSGSGALTSGQANSMQSKLEAAKASLEKENTTAAANQVAALIHQIDAILKKRGTTGDLAAALAALEEDLAAALALLGG